MANTSSEHLLEEMKSIWSRADVTGRGLTEVERARVETIVGILDMRKQVDAVGKSLGNPEMFSSVTGSGFGAGGAMSGDPGTRFVSSEGYKAISNPGGRGQKWSTGLIDCGPGGGMRTKQAGGYQLKGTMFEGSGSPGDGTGGGLLATPQVVPGVVGKLFQPLRIESLLSANQATGNTVRFIVEGTASSGATGVLEGGLKPESTLALSTLDEPVKKCATTLQISDELLEDAPMVQQYVSGRLGLFVSQEVERQIIRGTAGPELQGLLSSRGVPVYNRGTVDSIAISLFKGVNRIRGSAFAEPDFIVMNPTDWETVRLAQDNAGQFYGGGPFLGQYAGSQQVNASGQITGAIDTIWNVPVSVTAAIGAGTAIIGSSEAACIWSRGGLSIEATNAHSDLFVHDIVALRAERRLALTVFRSQSFLEVRF